MELRPLFAEVLGTVTKDECPSFDQKKEKNSLPFIGCLQHVKNSGLVIQCIECEMWRLIFSKYKLKPDEVREIQLLLDDYTYTCGSKLVDLLFEKFRNVEIRDHTCYDASRSFIIQQNMNQPMSTVAKKSRSRIQLPILSVPVVLTSPV